MAIKDGKEGVLGKLLDVVSGNVGILGQQQPIDTQKRWVGERESVCVCVCVCEFERSTHTSTETQAHRQAHRDQHKNTHGSIDYWLAWGDRLLVNPLR